MALVSKQAQGRIMKIIPVDDEQNLFRINNVFDQTIVDHVLATDWLNLPWQRQEGQESWPRRRIDNTALPWIDQWHRHMRNIWPDIEQQLGIPINDYTDTAFWLDEPGFTCSMHTDGEMPGSLHLTWIGSSASHGTAFYWFKDPTALRYQVPNEANAGYIMINKPDDQGYRKLLWHAMLTPVPTDTFRLTSYTWIIPK